MRRLMLPAAVAVALLTMVPAAAGAASPAVAVDGPGAQAAWRFTSADRCTVGDTFVKVNTSVVKVGSDTQTTSRLWIFESTADKCHSAVTQELVTPDGGAVLPAGAFQTDRFLGGATLDATVPVSDTLTGTPHTLSVHLAWTGRGDLARDNGGSRFHDASCTVGYHGTGTTRDATVSGSIAEAETEYAGYTSPEASLTTVKSGTVEVGCDVPSPAGGLQMESPARGLGAWAGFEKTDGCLRTYTDVSAWDEADAQSAVAPHSYVVYVDALQIDACTDEAVAFYRTGLYGASLPDGSLHIDDRLGTATLDLSDLPVVDLAHLTYATLDVHLTWTARSPADRYTSGSHSHTPYCNVSEHTQGVARSATATGSVTDGTVEFAGTSVGAGMESVQSPGSTVSRSC